MKNMFLLLAALCMYTTALTQVADSLHLDTTINKGKAIVFKNDTLFKVYTSLANITPEERATLIQYRLNRIAALDHFDQDKLTIVKDSAGMYNLAYDGAIIIYVSDKDAAANNISAERLAKNYQVIIRDKMLAYFAFKEPGSIAISAAEAIGIIVALILVIYIVNKLVKVLTRKYILQKPLPPVQLNKYQLISPQRYRAILLRLIGLLRWLFIIFVVYISLPLIFSLFPWTRSFADSLLDFVINPMISIVKSFVSYFPNMITILVIFLVTRYAVKLVRFFAEEITKGRLTIAGFYADWAMPTFNIIKALMYIFMFVAIFPYLPGANSKIFQGVSVFLGILFSIGSSSAIANVVAGIVITYMRPFKIGDRVKIGDVTGDVLEKNLLVTRIITIKNEEITMPNANILTGGTTNYSSLAKQQGLILHTTITIGYDAPWQQVQALLIKAAKATVGVKEDPSPFVLQTSLDDYYVSYQLNAYTEQPQIMQDLYSLLHQNIQDCFNEAGVEIMSPAYHSLRDGNTIAIPPDYRPEGYEPDHFTISSINNAKK
ncbi:mechanosensitive ion channel family protein [Danxiaibacter flavus]|uniref:Mechanosensitive ion channel family protein n=1 Tax=Danxiaibacter flavus TaxID=3049108 RepID=A0ABV3ZJD6_9BACT|nr:mechanosensitive ion channel family protein [Chitinophagaceae bacterium DXS]